MGGAELPRALATDFRSAPLDASDRAMLEYAWKLTKHPASVTAADVEGLRHEGFDDGAVLDICQVVSYYNYVNRLADGLGVELEDFWTPEMMIVTPEEFAARTADAHE